MTKGLSVKHIKAFMKASYDLKDTQKQLNVYILDSELSNKWRKAFYYREMKQVVVIHRGTKSAKDWRNNATIAIGAYKLTDRFKTGNLLQDQAEAKYSGHKIFTLGHS